MDLIFTKSETGKSWVAEFEATADFNLHIERDKGGNLMLYQRTNGGGWDIVNDFANPRFGAIDYDCAALIYPKFIKVVSEVEPTYAAVTFSSAGGNGGNSGGSGEDVIFFDGKILFEAFGYDLAYMFTMIFGMSSFINKTTYYVENYAGRLPYSESTFQSMGDPSELSYVCVSNSLTPTVVMMGSGNVEVPKQDKPITVYEFFEILVGMGMELPVDVFKAAEVSREVVEQWMQE